MPLINPVNFINPDGNTPKSTYGKHSAFNGDYDPNTSLSGSNGMGGSHGMYFANNDGGGFGSSQKGSGALSFSTSEGIRFAFSYFGGGGSIGNLFSMIDQLKEAGWDDPANTKAKFEDASKISGISAIRNLVSILNYVAKQPEESNVFFEKTNNWLINGQAQGYKILLNMNNIKNVLELTYIIGHETNHSITGFFSNVFYKTVGSKGPLGQNAFGYFTELISYSWEEKWGSTHRNLNANDYTYFIHGPNSPVERARHSQTEVDLVNKNLMKLLQLYSNFTTIQNK